MEKLTLWLVALMHAWVPTGYDTQFHSWRGARETREETEVRFRQIAEAMAQVTLDPAEQPVLPGAQGRAATAALLLGIAFYESGFSRDVDLGIGRYARGDKGHSWCLMQLNLGKKVVVENGTRLEDSAIRTPEGWSGQELLADRTRCFRAALHLVRRSWNCGALEDKLTVYASGTCVTASNQDRVPGGARIRAVSAIRVLKGLRYFYSHRPAFTDAELSGALLSPLELSSAD
jgi:hypothetical protein